MTKTSRGLYYDILTNSSSIRVLVKDVRLGYRTGRGGKHFIKESLAEKDSASDEEKSSKR